MKRQDRHRHQQPQSPKNASSERVDAKPTDKENQERHVYLKSIVLLDVVKELKDQHAKEREEDAGHQKRQLFWTLVAAIFVFLYTGAAFWQGCASQKAATAAKESADTAKNALYVSEKALILFEPPEFDENESAVHISYVNGGHVPTGPMTFLAYKVIYAGYPGQQRVSAADVLIYAKITQTFPTILPDQSQGARPQQGLILPVVDADHQTWTDGSEGVIVAGHYTYTDGFPGTPPITQFFCIHSIYDMRLKKTHMEDCVPAPYDFFNWMVGLEHDPDNHAKMQTN
jgi:hypothetical protein